MSVDRSAPVHVSPDAEAPAGLLDAFWRYESALMANDVAELDDLFLRSDDTIRGDAVGLLVGFDEIARFRGSRGGAPKRRIASVHVRVVAPEAAVIVAVTSLAAGGRGQQTQLWERADGAWRVAVAHVSVPPPSVDPSIWRLVGAPLVQGRSGGPLQGWTVAVKDLFAVAGHAVGAGVPAFLAEASAEAEHSDAVAAFVEAGADVRGIARTDEFAYSIAGRNPHYGTPPNVAMRGRIPGGSSSGSASAVALGQASIGLATDTAGSVRVPASYQALWGLRTTHGLLSRAGLLPLAPTFDAIGWLTRNGETLAAVADALLPTDGRVAASRDYAVAPAITACATDDVQEAFGEATARALSSGAVDDLVGVDLGDVDELFAAFRTVQAAEAWREHGAWIERHPDTLGSAVRERFSWASGISREEERRARSVVSSGVTRISETLAGRTLLLPSTSSPAPLVSASSREVDEIRGATLRMTCVAAIARRPALSVPALMTPDGPVGLCLVGPRASDASLVERGRELVEALGQAALP